MNSVYIVESDIPILIFHDFCKLLQTKQIKIVSMTNGGH